MTSMSANKQVRHISFLSILGRLLVVVALLCFVYTAAILKTAQAFDYPKLPNRSLRLGSSEPGVTTDYTVSWRWPSNASVGSVRFILCSDPYVLDPCSSTPPGDFSGAVLDNQSGALNGFSISTQTANEMVIVRGAAGSTGTGQHTFVFDNVVNPTGLHQQFFVQIFTYSSTDASGTPNHISSVASATVEPIVITAEVPPILYFCAALTIEEWCTDASGNYIDYGMLDPVNGHSATSQFGVATNAIGGYVVTVNGNTMTSGNKTIAALDLPAAYNAGVQQFGINLRANTNPALGQDAFGAGIGTVSPGYDVPDVFQFHSGDPVAAAPTGTLFNTFTVTYIVNVDADLPSGIYNTTIAYICTAAF